MRENWTYKKLGECFPYIKNGANIKQIKDAKGYPITRIETLSGGVFNRDRMGYADIFDINKFQDYLIEDGDLLMSHINSKTYIGRTVKYISKNNEKIIHGMNLLRLKSNESLILSSFFKFYTDSWHFKTDIARIRKDAVNQSSFAISDLKNFRIPLPSLSEQQAIVSELDKINELISLKKAQLSDLDALAQSIFYDMFGDPIENEKGWEVKKLDDICVSIVRGPFGSALKKEFFVKPDGTTYKIYEQKHAIQKNAAIGSYYITEERFRELSRFELRPYDIIMSCSGTIGELYRLPSNTERGIMNQALLKFTLNNNICYEYFYRMMEYMKHYFTVRGSGLQNIGSVKIIKSMLFGLPPLSLQQDFAKRIELIEQQKAQISSTIKDLETLLASRMQYWFD